MFPLTKNILQVYLSVYLYWRKFMSQIAIYIEPSLEKKLERAAKIEGKSRSAWVKEAILEKINARLPEGWFKIWGSWEDTRSTEEILSDIKNGYAETERESIK